MFVLRLTHAAAAVGAAVFAEGVGLIVGGLLAQSIIDRLPARELLVTLDLLRAAAAILLVIFPSFPMAVAVSLLLGLGTASFSPLSNAVVPRLVSDRALVAANGLHWTAGVLLQLVAAPAAGLLVTAGDARLAFAFNAASFVASGAVLVRLPYLPRIQERPRTAWQQLPELLAAIPRVPILRPLLAMQGLAALAVGATSALLVVLARNAYGLSGAGYGLWLSAIAAGALLGPLVVPLLRRVPAYQAVSGAYLIRGVGDIALGLINSPVGGGALLGLYGVNTSSGMVAYQYDGAAGGSEQPQRTGLRAAGCRLADRAPGIDCFRRGTRRDHWHPGALRPWRSLTYSGRRHRIRWPLAPVSADGLGRLALAPASAPDYECRFETVKTPYTYVYMWDLGSLRSGGNSLGHWFPAGFL